MKRILTLLSVAIVVTLASCGETKPTVELTEKGKLLTSVTWKYDTNASIAGVTETIEDTTAIAGDSTGIVADIELKDDVKAIADFFTGTLTFQVDKKGDLAYERKFGEGFLSTSTLGYWNFNEDESAVVMREWDSEAGAEKAAETYKVVELTAEKLVLQKDGEGANVYVPKK